RDRPEDLLGEGTLALTVDQGAHMHRYQGIVQLDGASLEEIARNYFRQSEQLPTELRLAVGRQSLRGADGQMHRSWRAGGVLVQFLPEAPERMRAPDLHPGEVPEGAVVDEVEDDDAWAEVKALVGTVDDDELVDEAVGVHALLYRLFHERGVRVYDPQDVREQCTCSRDRVRAVLASLSDEDRAEAAQDGTIAIKCEFCSTVYEFDKDDTGQSEAG
ncbi:Hsp33 family molecular chaperone HslO, partial [Roseitalea sp. MMSF_3516]|uniref:Hsp33 family molecular chaperone HslO n=1 Tax=Roseitalea sp. MMSF_3516 TaxID=3046719 RepID=UPI00273D5DB0